MKYMAYLLTLSIFIGMAVSSQIVADEDEGYLVVRYRTLNVIPHEQGTLITTGQRFVLDNDNSVSEFDLEYFFNKNIGIELIAGTTQHHVQLAGGTSIGSVKLLPPTLTLKYHHPVDQFSPYVGVGINYTHAFDQSGTVDTFRWKGSWGAAYQIGADYWISDNVFLNIDCKYVDIEFELHARAGGPDSKVKIDPIIFGVGIGYRF